MSDLNFNADWYESHYSKQNDTSRSNHKNTSCFEKKEMKIIGHKLRLKCYSTQGQEQKVSMVKERL